MGGQQGLHFSQGLAGSAGLLEQRFVCTEEMFLSDLCSAVPLRALPESSPPPHFFIPSPCSGFLSFFLFFFNALFFFIALCNSVQYPVCLFI